MAAEIWETFRPRMARIYPAATYDRLQCTAGVVRARRGAGPCLSSGLEGRALRIENFASLRVHSAGNLPLTAFATGQGGPAPVLYIILDHFGRRCATTPWRIATEAVSRLGPAGASRIDAWQQPVLERRATCPRPCHFAGGPRQTSLLRPPPAAAALDRAGPERDPVGSLFAGARVPRLRLVRKPSTCASYGSFALRLQPWPEPEQGGVLRTLRRAIPRRRCHPPDPIGWYFHPGKGGVEAPASWLVPPPHDLGAPK